VKPHKAKPLTAEQICESLGISKEKREAVRRMIEHLREQGKIKK
jgi:biotin operon repressor